MEVKPFLNHVLENFLQVEVLCTRAEKIREMATAATGGERGSPEPYVIELLDVHAALQEKVNKLLAESRVAEKLIETLEKPNQRAVLQLRYLCGYTFKEIAEKTCYTDRWVHRLHDDGITELKRRYEK